VVYVNYVHTAFLPTGKSKLKTSTLEVVPLREESIPGRHE
jgi:hypothetical protein